MDIKQIGLNNNLYTIFDRYLREQITRKFESSNSYNIGDFCIYNGQLYQCINNTNGSWDESKWEQKKVVDLKKYYVENLIDDTIFNSILEKNITSIERNSIKQIKSYAFESCSSLQSASFLQCTSIENNAFYRCSSLQSVNFPQCSTIDGYAFQYCSSLQSVSFPQCISIGSSAFASCSSLQSVNFPQCISISMYAFYYCTSLQSISFPQCISIGSYAFYYCTSLQSVYLLASSICTLLNSGVFSGTPIQYSSYLGYYGSIYVPSSLVSAYKVATNWIEYADRITAFTG